MKVSIIIPNYNGKRLLEKNIPIVIAAAKEVEIIVVDDTSQDESVSFLKKVYPQIHVVTRRKNEGFASTVNDGVRKARGELVFLLNSDVIPSKDFLQYLTSHFRDENVFAVGCLEKSIEGEKTVLRGRGIGSFQRGFLIHKRGEVDKNNTLWVSGGAGMFRKKIWERLHGLTTLYNPFYWEDIDLSYRAVKNGYKIIFEPKSVVTHTHHEGVIHTLYSIDTIKTIAYRNQFFFVWLNITDRYFIFEHLIFIPFHLFRAFVRGDFSFLRGFFLAFFQLSRVLLTRRENQKQIKQTDRSVLKNISS